MPKLAIVSTYNENCGNASYTHVLKTGFEKYIDVDIIPLDLFLTQSKSSRLVRAADRHIKQICKKLKDYDFVNIQFEGGLYGASIVDIERRIKWLIDAAPNLIITMHRVDTAFSNLGEAVKLGLAARSYKRFKTIRGGGQFAELSRSIINHCKKRAKHKNVWIKVHTRREVRAVREIFDNDYVFDYPLAFLTPDEQIQARTHSNRGQFLQKYGFQPGDKIVGLFGYLSNYKGIETAIEALGKLPNDYKLGMFGSQHPQTIKRNETVNPYLKSLFDLMGDIDNENYRYVKREMVTKLGRKKWQAGRDRPKADPIPAGDQGDLHKFTNADFPQLERIGDRVRFIGSLPDPEFIEALRLCDAVVLPYVEVGQSMSGVAVLAMEAGAKMLCSNNLSFAETRRYFPDTYLSFDVGNAYELAQKIVMCSENPASSEFHENRMKCFAKYNIDSSIKLQLEKFGYNFDGVN
jgi:glycosyltransferase involved in cell wall biosynthesis